MATTLTSIDNALDCRGDSLAELDRTLSSDRYGEIRAIIVSLAGLEASRAIVERCWHDAVVIPDEHPHAFPCAA